MIRKFLTDDWLQVADLARIARTRNDKPIWGRAAGTLFLRRFDWAKQHGWPGAPAFLCVLHVEDCPAETSHAYDSACWFNIERSEEVPAG